MQHATDFGALAGAYEGGQSLEEFRAQTITTLALAIAGLAFLLLRPAAPRSGRRADGHTRARHDRPARRARPLRPPALPAAGLERARDRLALLPPARRGGALELAQLRARAGEDRGGTPAPDGARPPLQVAQRDGRAAGAAES